MIKELKKGRVYGLTDSRLEIGSVTITEITVTIPKVDWHFHVTLILRS